MQSPNVWDSILSSIEKKVNHESFDTWFRPISFVQYEEQQIQVNIPDRIFEDWILNNYRDVLAAALDEQQLSGTRVVFNLKPGSPQIAEPVVPQTRSTFANNDSPESPETLDVPLNRRYTFGTFVVGSCNQFAHAAALAVAETPSKTYNPLFIYGGVGLGKTHLMCAIGERVKSYNPHLKLSYISAEKFMNELINAIRYDRTMSFREKYRSIDVLLIDDIQFIAGKERTQEEFFHTFNALYDNQKQIVISSDCPPREIPTLEERLHSRFEWGLIADIQPPDLETKVAILRKKAETDNITLPDNVALFIASKVKSNIRELEGSLVRLTALASLRGEPITVAIAQEALKNIVEEDERAVTIETIQKVVADYYNMKVADLKAKTNARNIAVPRQVAMYLCKNLTKASLPEIGREFGGKHHSTVLHSIHKISELYDQKGSFHRLINSLIINCQ